MPALPMQPLHEKFGAAVLRIVYKVSDETASSGVFKYVFYRAWH